MPNLLLEILEQPPGVWRPVHSACRHSTLVPRQNPAWFGGRARAARRRFQFSVCCLSFHV